MKEIWKDINGYEGLYQISDLGRVKSIKRHGTLGGILKSENMSKGYCRVKLYKNCKGKKYLIHCLVWDIFNGINRENLTIDHIDNTKNNNCINNLQLLTNRKNVSKGHLDNGNKSSQYVGVCWNKLGKKWAASIYINGNHKYLGLFDNEYKGHLAYQKELEAVNV